MNHIGWALLGMAGYSAVTLLVKLATRDGGFKAFAVLAIATSIVAVAAVANAVLGGFFTDKTAGDFLKPGALYAYAAGIALTIAVGSLFKGLSVGPASVVVPIYGMFILGGSLLAVVFLGEPMTARKILGLTLCVVGVYFVAA